MKRLWIILVMFVTFAGAGNAYATLMTLIVQDFEGIPDTYLRYGGNQNLNGYLPGLFFGPDVKVLDRMRYSYNYNGYPPHSGDAVIGTFTTDYIKVDFVGLPSNPDYVQAWYTSTDTFYMEAYDTFDNLVDWTSGPSDYGYSLGISVSGQNIAYVKFHNSGEYFSIDDLAYTPEPATLSLLGLGSLALFRKRRT